MTSKLELQLTKVFKDILSEKNTPQSQELWELLDTEPINLCPDIYEKKAGAKADACFLKKDKLCLLIENKCYGAPLTPRQELLYANHFMHFHANHLLAFSEHKLIFIAEENSNYFNKLKAKFTPSYKFPLNSLEKSHLSNIRMLSEGSATGNGVKYWVSATYKNVTTNFMIDVTIVGVNPRSFEIYIPEDDA